MLPARETDVDRFSRPHSATVGAMARASGQLSDALNEYVTAHSAHPDEVLRDLAAETARLFPEDADMQIGPGQGTFMTMLARLIGARSAIEVGTFTGYSSICIARGLAAGGRLRCFDVSAEFTAVARRYWQRAGLADQIELRLGPAADSLAGLDPGTRFDYAFVDADKTGYPRYWDLIVPLVRPGGLILVDNTLSHGRVVDDAEQGESVRAIREFNARALADHRTEVVLLPIGDGLTMARRL